MLSIEGWLYGISASAIVISGTISGLFFIYKAKKSNVSLLLFWGIGAISGSFGWLGNFCDFITILLTEQNINNPNGLVGILSFIWVAPYILISVYISAELLIPRRKKYILSIIIFLCVIFELFVLFDPVGTFTFFYPENSGEHLIDDRLVISSFPGIILSLSLPIGIAFSTGFIYKSTLLQGLMKSKFRLLGIAGFLTGICGVLDSFINPGIVIVFIRFGTFTSFWLNFYGLKPIKLAKPKKKKVPSKKEVELASYILQKSNSIEQSDDSVTFSIDLGKNVLVFVSYATTDTELFKIHEIAKLLSELPEIDNVLYWEEHMEDNIFEYMDENLGKCDAMVLFCSENALKSIPVKKEWTAAEALGKPIIPVFYNPNHIPPLLSSRLGLQFDFYDMKKNIRELRYLLLKKIGGMKE
ncbi:MAG: toll/interleukin-1 receptor domain-containing protein [Candidatus Hodarchaeota archaeon]